MPGDEGNGKKKMKQKPKTKLKNPKDHQAGRVAHFRSPAQNIRLTWRLAQDLHPEGNRCGVTKHRALATSP